MQTLATQQIYIAKTDASSWIYTTSVTGKIIYRDKIDTLIGTQHPGIIIGDDMWGTTWVIHNHYKNGKVEIVTLDQFAEGVALFYDTRPVFYNPTEIVQRAMEAYREGKEYRWLTYNCQHFINNVTQNEHYSETIDKVADNVLIAGGLTTVVGILINNKDCVATGLAIAGIGTIGKGISRYTTN